ncbi:MAG: hypothetical protein HYR63_02900 [Proteobacteria bacterium]|nr:hypothetical protein [Pseudomonadota bacterium]MBI3496265.1 hypothetical protein [Pseudomonadota bacterium]
MSWITDLANTSGIPAGAATLAAAMFGACVAAEKAARPEALRDIGRILKDPSWERSVRPSAIILRVFNWTFGERHLSWKCVFRSMAATLVLIGGLGLSLHLRSPTLWVGMSINHFDGWWGIVLLFCLGIIPDYASLAKARFILAVVDRSQYRGAIVAGVCADIVLSIFVSAFGLFITNAILYRYVSVARVIDVLGGSIVRLGDIFSVFPLRFNIFELFLLSTFFTSIWTILMLIATIVLKLLSPVHRFTAWFFDVEKHPVRAVGLVAGALIVLGSLVWTAARMLI